MDLALQYFKKGNDSNIFNLVNRNRYSVKEVIEAARKVTEHEIHAVVKERTTGS